MRFCAIFMLLLLSTSFGADANYVLKLKGGAKAGLHTGEMEERRAAVMDSQRSVVRELGSLGVEVRHQFWLTNSVSVYIPPGKLSEIESLPGVEAVSPVRKVFPLRQDGVGIIGAPAAWDLGLNGSGVKIAIVDTGINKTHPELVGRVINETDVYTPDGFDPMDYAGHGTHVAGIATGSTWGVARNASILNAKIFPNGGGSADDFYAVAGIEWAVSQGADVISLSIGSNETCGTFDILAQSADAAAELGVVVVAAAGNSGPSSGTIDSPGCAKGPITVGATDDSDNVASFSSRGPAQNRTKPDVTAPGVNIYSTSKTGGYEYKSGTSMATPFVSGAAAILLEKRPALTQQMLKALIMNSAKDLGSPGFDNVYGAGRLNLSEAVRQADFVVEDNASSSGNRTYSIYVPNTLSSLRVTLYWSENWTTHSDLNLTLLSPNGTAFSNINSVEAFEQVSVSQPQPGPWQLAVSSDSNRSFALAFTSNATFGLAPSAYNLNAEVNSTFNFTFALESYADFNDSFQMLVNSSLGYNLSNSAVYLGPFASANITLFASVPLNATAGSRFLSIEAVSNVTGRRASAGITVNVSPAFGIMPSAYNLNAEVNSTFNFTFALESYADFNDSFQMLVNSSLGYNLSNSTVYLSPLTSANLSFSAVIPANATLGSRFLSIEAVSNATGQRASAGITVNVFDNITLSLSPLADVNRSASLDIFVNATNSLNLSVTNASLVAALNSPGANYTVQLSYSAGFYYANFTVPPNSSVGVWNVYVNTTNPYYRTSAVNSSFTVFGHINASILANQTLTAGYAYLLNSTVADEVGNPLDADVRWFFNGTNVLNGTGGTFQPLLQHVGTGNLSLSAERQHYRNGTASVGVSVTDPPPVITNLTLLPSHLLLPNETLNVSALVSDNLNLSAVWANVTYPGGDSYVFFLGGSGNAYSRLLNFSGNGTYSLGLFANDSGGNAANISDVFFVLAPANVSFSLNLSGLLRVLPEDYNETRGLANASASMLLPGSGYRLRLELPNATFQFSNVSMRSDMNVTLAAGARNFSDNEVFLPLSAYEVSTTANFSSARVSFPYAPGADPSLLSIFHCTSVYYGNCTPIATSIDNASRIAYADVQAFSVYLLGQNRTFSAAMVSGAQTVASGDTVRIAVNVTLDGAAVSDANFSVSVGGSAVSASSSFSGGLWNLSFSAPSRADGAAALAVQAFYGVRFASAAGTLNYANPAPVYVSFSGGTSYSSVAYRNASNSTANASNELVPEKIALELGEVGNFSIIAGSERVIQVLVSNSGGREFVVVSLSGIGPSFFFSDSGFVNASGSRGFSILVRVPLGTVPGNYTLSADALVGGKTQASRPFLLEITEKRADTAGNLSRIIARTNVASRIVRGGSPVLVMDLMTARPENVTVNYVVRDLEAGTVVSNYSEPLLVEKSGTLTRTIHVPSNLSAGFYVIETVLSYGGGVSKDIATFEAAPPAKLELPESAAGPYAIFTVAVLAGAILAGASRALRKSTVRNDGLLVDARLLPSSGGSIGNVRQTRGRAFIGLDSLLLHMLAAGGTGSGKTVAVMDIVEEALSAGVKVVVFDPTAQWTGFPKAASGEMLGRYAQFGMGERDRRGYPANIVGVSDAKVAVSLKELPPGLTVFDMHGLKVRDLDRFLENTINAIFASALPESKTLKYLLVYDEIHRSLPKYGGKRSYVAIERGCREFRKWGIGLVMVSQVLSDFRGAIRANIGTELQMRTKYEADIERIRSKFGPGYGRLIPALRVGEGLLHNPEYNAGRPYVVQFRPLRHSESRASDEELERYVGILGRADALEGRLAGPSDMDGLRVELSLAREKARIFAFRMAETYLDSVEARLKADGN